MTVVVANLVVVTHRGVGWHSRAREHGNCNYSKQYVPEDSHDFAPFSDPAALAPRPDRWMQHDMNALWATQNFP
jgi:hypothetical protein